MSTSIGSLRRPGRSLRWTVESLVLFLAVVLLLRTWCVQGLFAPFQVASGSMTPTLLGPHRQIVCGNCGFDFVCAADRWDFAARIVCPNCQDAVSALGDQRPASEGRVVAGDRLFVDKTTFQLRSPRRWEIVAFRDPQHPSRVAVKRVVGLPGETIQIRDGDVFADGQIARKSLAQQRATAVLVHDAGFWPRQGIVPPPRWRPEQAGQAEPAARAAGWVVEEGRFTHPESPGQASPDWLAYVHRRRLPGPLDVLDVLDLTIEAPIGNVCSCNQALGEQGENFDPATDLMLAFRVARTNGRGELGVRIGDGWEEFEVWIDPANGRVRVLRNGQPPGDGQPDAVVPAVGGRELVEGVEVEVSTFDRQLLVALDGRTIVALPYQRSGPPGRRDSRRPAIGCRGLGVEISEVRVFRDIYYTRPAGWTPRWGLDSPVQLGDNEYFVLGDDSPVSDDSRSWPQGPGLAAELLVGKPLLVHWPVRDAYIGGWHFQVPDLSGIRYIR